MRSDHPLFTIGHSNHPVDDFLALLARQRVETVADVRSVPYSRFAPQYRKAALAAALAAAGIGYLFLGAQLGGKPRRGELAAARLDYAGRVREPTFRDGIAQLLAAVRQARVALLCRERDPLDCHRLHLICRHLAPAGLDIRHILPDGRIEPQSDTERRLLARADAPLLAIGGPAVQADALRQEYDRWWRENR
ncbi:MAG TPA: DUF488 domain-containing protein [Geminicoccaceae bacterium]|nr:DUF488 domain-containing protein [Geminicoccaceae bacterium]